MEKNKLIFIEKEQEKRKIRKIEKNLRELLLSRDLELNNNNELEEKNKILFTKQFILLKTVFEVGRNYKNEGGFYEE